MQDTTSRLNYFKSQISTGVLIRRLELEDEEEEIETYIGKLSTPKYYNFSELRNYAGYHIKFQILTGVLIR